MKTGRGMKELGFLFVLDWKMLLHASLMIFAVDFFPDT
jgi:hypothetical protein